MVNARRTKICVRRCLVCAQRIDRDATGGKTDFGLKNAAGGILRAQKCAW